MFQVRFHGRGGQGVVTGAELLSVAAFLEGKFAQAFPSFGSERMGSPVTSFCRIDEREIRLREPILEPDALVIQDPTLLHSVDVFQGMRVGGYLLLNSNKPFDELGLSDLVAGLPRGHARTIPATALAWKHLGKAMPNSVLLGGFAALTGTIGLDSIVSALTARFKGPMRDANIAAATEAYSTIAEGTPC
jgi:pyruvate ferredoxin oxidoreductase gamma subunit